MLSGSARMRYQEVVENYLRSGTNQGKVMENESREKWPPYLIENLIKTACERFIVYGTLWRSSFAKNCLERFKQKEHSFHSCC